MTKYTEIIDEWYRRYPKGTRRHGVFIVLRINSEPWQVISHHETLEHAVAWLRVNYEDVKEPMRNGIVKSRWDLVWSASTGGVDKSVSYNLNTFMIHCNQLEESKMQGIYKELRDNCRHSPLIWELFGQGYPPDMIEYRVIGELYLGDKGIERCM
jgi:hypothetical protein